MPDPHPEDIDFDAELDDLDLTMRMSSALADAANPDVDPATALLPASLVYRADALAHPQAFTDGHLRSGPGTTAVQMLLTRIGVPEEFREAVLGLCEGSPRGRCAAIYREGPQRGRWGSRRCCAAGASPRSRCSRSRISVSGPRPCGG